nr:hypothetical protein Iba_chr09aCG16470 [Ipomoea batatas]
MSNARTVQRCRWNSGAPGVFRGLGLFVGYGLVSEHPAVTKLAPCSVQNLEVRENLRSLILILIFSVAVIALYCASFFLLLLHQWVLLCYSQEHKDLRGFSLTRPHSLLSTALEEALFLQSFELKIGERPTSSGNSVGEDVVQAKLRTGISV